MLLTARRPSRRRDAGRRMPIAGFGPCLPRDSAFGRAPAALILRPLKPYSSLPPKADDGERRPADPLAHHEALRRPWRERLHHLPGPPGLSDQGVLCQLLPAHVRRELRSGPQPHASAPAPRRALVRDAGGHRRAHADRRAPAPRAAIPAGGRALLLYLWRRPGRP